MAKVVVMIRVSTEAQELDAQKKEMIEFCAKEGYSKDDMIIVEDKGASAIKLNAKYLSMIEQVKNYILEDSDVDCFAVWALNRVARNEEVFMNIKNFMIEHKIQMIIKNPYLKLLNDDGTVNNGMELAATLLSTLAKQEMEEKKERFRRGKEANKEKGKFIGGRLLYGYKTDINGFLILNEEEATVIRLIFTLYNEGNKSTFDVCKELTERGYYRRDGSKWGYVAIANVLNNEKYKGTIVSVEDFEKAKQLLANNRIAIRHGEKNCVLLSQLIKCPECGSNFVSSGFFYKCSRRDQGHKLSIKQELADTAVWNVVKFKYMAYIVSTSLENVEKLKEGLEVVRQKIDACNVELSKFKTKKEKIVEAYLDDEISEEKKIKRLADLEIKVKETQRTVTDLKQKESNITHLIERDGLINTANSLADSSMNLTDVEEIKKAIHLMVNKIDIRKVEHYDEVYKLNYKATELEITYYDGNKDFVRVIGYKKRGGNFYMWNKKEHIWNSMLSIHKIEKGS